ncbi:MAG: metal ABC transporter ATP-binding protein [bacterium]
MSEDLVLSIKNLSFSYGESLVLDNISLDVKPREFLGVVGPNAGGKSTLLKLILGLLKPTRGTIEVFGEIPEVGRTRIGYVPQYPAFKRDFPITVEHTVLMGRLGKTRWFGGYSKDDKVVARRVMTETEVDALARRQLGTLSGGQLQRVLMARALACEPDILILDEPTANIDQRMETDIFDLLKRLNKNLTIIVVSHDIGFISQYVTRVACINQTLMCHHTSHIDGQLIDQLYGAHVHHVEHLHG